MEIEIDNSSNGNCIWYHKRDDRYYYHRIDGPAIIGIGKYGGEEYWHYYNIFYQHPEDMPLELFLSYCKWKL